MQKNKLKFRSGHYTGKGWEVQEYSQLLKQGVANYGGQIGWYMVRTPHSSSSSKLDDKSAARRACANTWPRAARLSKHMECSVMLVKVQISKMHSGASSECHSQA
jgi:hypothetical protein